MLVLGLLASWREVRAAEFSLTATGTKVNLGNVTPGQPATVPYAVQIVVVSTGMPYSLQATAPADFATTIAPLTMPIDRAAWRLHGGAGAFTDFMAGLQTIRSMRPATPPAGEATVLDIRLSPAPTDAATRPDGTDPYSAVIVYSVTAGTVDTSYAAPNPFSPDGDGINDQTELHWFQQSAGLVDVTIYASDGVTVVRTLVQDRAFAGMAEQFVSWDGRDDDRLLAPEADYLYRVTDSATGAGIAAGMVGLERGVPTGTATVSGIVRSSQGNAPVAGATVELYRAGGSRFGVATTDAVGSYLFASVAAGTYFLRVAAPLHFPFESATFEVGAGPLTYDVLLVHNHSLTIKKSVDPVDAEPGDLVVFTVEVSTRGGVTRVEDIVVDDVLPVGLRLVPDSLRVNGGTIGRDALAGGGDDRRLAIPIGSMDPSQLTTVTYAAMVVPGTRPGRMTNRASAIGVAAGQAVRAGPTFATVFVHDGDMGDRSLVFGRVFLDKDRDGRFSRGDAPLIGARVVCDDGTVVVVDAKGRYSMKGVRRGARLFMAVVRAREASSSTATVPSGPSKLALRDLDNGVAAEIDFPFTVREASAEGDASPSAVLGVVDATIGLDLLEDGAILRVLGRIGMYFERDLGGGYRLSGSVDTRRSPRDENSIGEYQLAFQPETGDTSFAIRPAQDKIGLKLSAPWGRAELLRTGVSLGNVELINPNRRYLGVDVLVDKKTWWKVTAFLGRSDSMSRVDRFENDGTTGPFQLSAAPVLLSSERIFVETVASDGSATSRFILRAGADYTLDINAGLLVLHAPRPVEPGEQVVYVVEYEYFPPDDLPPSLIAGGRATASVNDATTVGASFFLEEATPGLMAAFGLDGRYATDRASVIGEVAIASRSETREAGHDDPTAVRVRGQYRVTPEVDVFAFFNRIGDAYKPKTNFLTVAPSPVNFSQLPTSQPLIALRVLQGLFDGQQEFPFFLAGDAGLFESGLGTQYRPREDLDLSAGTFLQSRSATDFTHFATGRFHAKGYPSAFLGLTEQVNGLRDSKDRALVVGTRFSAPLWDVESGLRAHWLDGGPNSHDITGQSGLLRLRYKKFPLLQPGVIAFVSREFSEEGDCDATSPGCEIVGNLIATGFESMWRKITTFVYAGEANTEDILGQHRRRFSTLGTLWGLKRFVGNVRLMIVEVVDDLVMDRTTVRAAELTADVRVRVFLTDSVSAFGFVAWRSGKQNCFIGDACGVGESGTWHNVIGVAYRPIVRPRFYLFLKLRHRQVLGRDDPTRAFQTQLGTVDFVVPVRRSLHLGTRYAWKRAATEDADVNLTVAAEEVTWRVSRRYHAIFGMRLANSSDAGDLQLGATLAAGMLVSDMFRVTVGLNFANDRWVFDADDSIPGFFLNLTGFYGAAGAPAEIM